ncbi:alkaline phosphatase D family protein [Nocardioides sp.]|uniref:alkaline phosphatase D family protein n=1 Tax=Nocardioides sp. TaxID=35761 RepID=UPI002637FE37|nr:alkaline phosphatase D family protein [Nocardioides sp.]
MISFARWKRRYQPVWHSDLAESGLPRSVRARHRWLHEHLAYDAWRLERTHRAAARRRLRAEIGRHRRELARLHRAHGGILATPGGPSTAVVPPPNPKAPPATHTFFAHGLASGDPLPDRVVLWTRVTPSPEATPGSGAGPTATVLWHVATDRTFRRVLRSGSVTTDASRDHTVKLDVTGLAPDTTYFFRFVFQGPWRTAQVSPIARTRTAPAPSATPTHLRLGVVSCANLQAGWFSAYRHLAERDDLHAVLHLGDYVYEYAPGQYGYGADDVDIRAHVPAREMVSLSDYRQRHAQYKQDPDLAALHQRYVMISTWDDHESADNSWKDGAANHTPATEGAWATRKAAAMKAYDEWMPVRLEGTATVGDGTTIYRRFGFGQLAELTMLDLRSYRDEQVSAASPATTSPDRTITGAAQMAFLKQGLTPTAAQWRLVGNPVTIAPLQVLSLPASVQDLLNGLGGGAYLPNPQGLNTDQWDGYTADRTELFDHIVDQGVRDVVFLTGDIHTSWCNELPYPVANANLYALLGGTAGVEFVGPSITSNNIKDYIPSQAGTPTGLAAGQLAASAVRLANPHVKYLDFNNHGFMVVDITPARVQCDWWFISDRADRKATITWATSWETRTGTGQVRQVAAPVAGGPTA